MDNLLSRLRRVMALHQHEHLISPLSRMAPETSLHTTAIQPPVHQVRIRVECLTQKIFWIMIPPRGGQVRRPILPGSLSIYKKITPSENLCWNGNHHLPQPIILKALRMGKPGLHSHRYQTATDKRIQLSSGTLRFDTSGLIAPNVSIVSGDTPFMRSRFMNSRSDVAMSCSVFEHAVSN